MIKKFIPYVAVGIVSAVTTVGTIKLLPTQNQKEYFSWANEKQETKNSLASYKLANYDNMPENFVSSADKSVNSVVSIKNYATKSKKNIDPFFEDFFNFGLPQQKQNDNLPSGLGSGVIISNDGYIITNNHVIDAADKIEVVLNNQKTYTAEVIGTDPNTDIALIKINEKDLPFLSFSNSDNIKVGEWVLAIGNPFGLNSTVTAGIISAQGRSLNILRTKGNSPIESFIQTDAAINPGNSGGALVNTNGDLIGINTAISSQTGSYIGYGFAVPSNLAKKIVEDIRRFGVVQRGYLGVNSLDLSDDRMIAAYNQDNKTKIKQQEGVMIIGLTPEGGAIEAGLEKKDIITEIEGEKIKSFANLSFAIGNKRPGDVVNVKVLREGKEKSYKVTLKDSKGNIKLKSKSDMSPIEVLGANFLPLSERQKINYGLESGVIVTDISEGKLKSLGIDDDYIILKINDKLVNSPKDIEKILTNYKGNVSIEYLDPYGRITRRGFKID